MLNENIRNLRKNKGLSQEELAVKLNVVRQTVSKWENGLSVPDSEMLLRLAEELDTNVSTLIGEKIKEDEKDDLKTIAEKLEVINLQFSKRARQSKIIARVIIVFLLITIILGFVFFAAIDSCYLEWDYSNPELAVSGTILHAMEFIFVRIAPLFFLMLLIILLLTFIYDISDI